MSDTNQPANLTRLQALLSRHFATPPAEAAFPLDLKILEDLKPDSLDVVELIMEIEDEFQIVITDDEVMDLGEDVRLADILALIERKLGAAG